MIRRRQQTREFEQAVQAFHADLYRFAYWLTRHEADAEDLVQDCFQRAWRGWQSLQDEQAVKQWLFVILRREFLRRFAKKRPVLIGMDDGEVSELSVFECPDRQYGLNQALEHLALPLREALLLQVLGGFSCEEIAQLQETTAGAVMTRLTRARQALRRVLQEERAIQERI